MAAVTFWWLPEEEERFLRYLLKTGDILACTFERASEPELLASRPLPEFIAEHDPDDVMIGPREFMEQARVWPVEYDGRTFYVHSYSDDPLIVYTRAKFRSPGKLGQSNLCTDWKRIDPDLPYLVDKPAEFIKWGRRVFAWVRRATPERYKTTRISKRVAEELANGLELVD